MILILNSEEEWKLARNHHPDKHKNSHYIKKFNEAVMSIHDRYDGVLEYHNISRRTGQSKESLEYTENSPFFRLFKISPARFYLDHFDRDYLWKRHSIDPAILSRYEKETNKYSQSDNLFDIQHDYILFTLQSNENLADHSFNIKTLIDILRWSKENRKHVYFKLHPFTSENSHVVMFWEALKSRGEVSEYSVLVGKDYNLDHLIDNCEALWTFSSGSGFQGVIKRKPVAHFYPNVDFRAVSQFARTPEEASLAMKPNEDELMRFLSWYYHKLTIDVSDESLIDKLNQRFTMFFKEKKTIDEIF